MITNGSWLGLSTNGSSLGMITDVNLAAPEIVKQAEDSFPDADRFTYYGYKFEALCTGEAQVDASSEFAALVQLRLGCLRLLMAAEVDCKDPAEQGQGGGGIMESYLELKTFRCGGNASSYKSFIIITRSSYSNLLILLKDVK